MPKLFAVSIALFLLLGAGYGALQAARATPWDCSDWQPYAHDDRTTAILESLAENRGKTLYCGIDQSDTFAKAETWEAGKDRNERDDTVYFGERGSFRGFIAAQEGWLTDGESGITGQSIAVIFEFPKEERRIRRTKRINVGSDNDRFPINAVTSCGEVLGLICSNEVGRQYEWGSDPGERRKGQRLATGLGPSSTHRQVTWDTNLRYHTATDPWTLLNPPEATPNRAWWQGQAEAAAARACRARGARLVAGSAALGMGHSENSADDALNYSGPGLGFFFRRINHPSVPGSFRYQTRQSRTWTATCLKKIRRNR